MSVTNGQTDRHTDILIANAALHYVLLRAQPKTNSNYFSFFYQAIQYSKVCCISDSSW